MKSIKVEVYVLEVKFQIQFSYGFRSEIFASNFQSVYLFDNLIFISFFRLFSRYSSRYSYAHVLYDMYLLHRVYM